MRVAFPVRLSVAVLMLLLAGVAGAADDLIKAKAVYAEQLQTIRQTADTTKHEALTAYRRSLDQLRQKAKLNGDLDAIQTLDGEITRFDQQKNPPAAPAGDELIKTATLCHDSLSQADADGARKVVQLTDKYLAFLDQHVKQAVREDHLDVAKTFKSEMDAVKEAPDYQAAKFVLAEKQPAAAVPPEAAPPTNAPPTTRPTSDKNRMRTSPDGLYDAARILEGLPPASMAAPSPYRALMAAETGHAPQAGGLIGLTLDGYLDNNTTHYQLRIKLRQKTSGEPTQNLKLLVQYFVRNPSGGAIQESGLQYAPIASVSAKSTTCEMKPAELPYASTSYRMFRGGDTVIVGGREGAFVGVVVSAFASDDKLLAQVTSFPTLKDKGRTTFEAPSQWQDHGIEVERVTGPNGSVFHIRRRIEME